MKYFNLKASVIIISFMGLLFASCSDDILDETPRSTYEPGFFETEAGVLGGLTSMYAHLRDIYGQAYYYNTTLTGTDEVTYAQSADQNFLVMDVSGQGNITAQDSRADVIWNTAFTNINTANGVLEYSSGIDEISPAMSAEANFFRAFDYFLLVQTFGGVPLDLGSGSLMFNVSPSRTSVRNTVPEVYTQAIFPDLLTATENLPSAPRVTGGVTKPVAQLYLAKAYLTYGWWLENPHNIPTYPETGRTDPDGHDAQWYFQQAYDIATDAINNPGPYSLQETFYDVNNAENDRNSEIMLYADHTETSEFYNGGSLTYGNGSAPDNFAGWMMTWNYTVLRSSSTPDWSDPVSSVQRSDNQFLGRPWTRMTPTIGAITETFADKNRDSRYDGTFTTTYRGNWNKAGIENEVLYNANGLPVEPGDAILTFLDEEPNETIIYPNDAGNSNIGAGEISGRSDFVISPQGISRVVYPGLWKLGPYRTNTGDGLGQPNAGSTRPYNIAKFSELYFIAAEAAVKGAAPNGGQSARDLINVIRARAGVWRWDNNGNQPREEDFSNELVSETPSEITINYLLEERSREYFGEGIPWKGNYSSWLDQKSKRMAQEQKAASKRQKTLERELEWVKMAPKGRQAKQKARLNNYDKLLSQDQKQIDEKLEIYIPNGPRLGTNVIEAKGVSKAFGDKLLYEDLNFNLPQAGIVGIIGPNGAGKTTIFKMIMGEEQPDKGSFEVGETAKIAYVDQGHANIDPEKTIWQNFSDEQELVMMGGRQVNSRAYLSRFNFSGSEQNKKVSMLSGGERNRLHLAMTLKEEGNVLLLDEPTNDLDVNTLRALEEGLENFAGCAVVISHDRWFLDRICTHILAFEGDSQVYFFEGGFSDYEENKKKRLGGDVMPKRIKYKRLTRN